MGRPIDYDAAADVLRTEYDLAEESFREGRVIEVSPVVAQSITRMFESRTQSHREMALGCVLAFIIDSEIDITLPYMNLGERAFHARDLDQRVVNPFLREHAIPSTTGPYLATQRRSVAFVPETARGVRDKGSFGALIDFIHAVADTDENGARVYLRALLVAFINLREAANIPLADVRRISLDQYAAIIDGLLPVPSGGALPVLLAVATFETLSDCFDLHWRVERQGINVADRARGEAGDITVYRNAESLFSVEVTERQIDRERVAYVFDTKIAPNGLADYLFFFTAREPTPEAREAARQYFAQGHDINLIPIRDWIITTLTTIGPRCRRIFTEKFREMLGGEGVPAALKVAWNDQLRNLVP